MIPDIIEQLEAQAESRYYKMLNDDGSLTCGCGRKFFPQDEGAVLTGNPYDMPVCGECFNQSRPAGEEYGNG